MTVLLISAALAGGCVFWAAAGAVAATIAFIGMVYLMN
jgi:hypothetical protein